MAENMKNFKLTIGHLKYNVKFIDELEAERDGVYGDCNRFKQLIRIKKNMPKDRFKEVLLHECLHAMFDTENIYHSNDEECVVNGLGMGLTKLFRDNKIMRDIYGASK